MGNFISTFAGLVIHSCYTPKSIWQVLPTPSISHSLPVHYYHHHHYFECQDLQIRYLKIQQLKPQTLLCALHSFIFLHTLAILSLRCLFHFFQEIPLSIHIVNITAEPLSPKSLSSQWSTDDAPKNCHGPHQDCSFCQSSYGSTGDGCTLSSLRQLSDQILMNYCYRSAK